MFVAVAQWITQDFVDKLMTKPDLPQSESFERAIEEFIQSPEEAYKKYRNNKFVMDGFRKYMSVIGEHLASLPSS
jgi:hypothetical protein